MNIKKYKNLVPFIFGLAIMIGCNRSPDRLLRELESIGTSLKKTETKEYAYFIKTFRSYGGDTTKNHGIMYFEENLRDTSIGFNFYNKSENSESFYNGEFIVTLLKKDSVAWKKPLCDFDDGHMTVYPYLELSLGAIRNFLIDSSLSLHIDSLTRTDTIFNNEKCSSYTFWADNILVDTHKKMLKGRKRINLIVRKKDNIPLFYSQYEPIQRATKLDYHYSEVVFKNIRFDKQYPKSIFSIESVPGYYSWDRLTSIGSLLPVNFKAPEWRLPLVSGDSISLNALRGKYVLLDFWFIGCGGCVQSIPVLNELQEKYTNEDLMVVGINCFSNQVEKIREYSRSYNMNYLNVWNGDIICADYKVNAAPIFYLIDRNGNIVYRQIGHDEKEIKQNIERILGNV